VLFLVNDQVSQKSEEEKNKHFIEQNYSKDPKPAHE
jgi:hypothetical protein